MSELEEASAESVKCLI